MHSQLHGAWYTFPRLIYVKWKKSSHFLHCCSARPQCNKLTSLVDLFRCYFVFFDTLFSLFSSCAERIQIRTNLKYNLHMVDYITHEVVWLAVGLWFIYIYMYIFLFLVAMLYCGVKMWSNGLSCWDKREINDWRKIDARLGLRRVNEEDYKTLLVQSTFVCWSKFEFVWHSLVEVVCSDFSANISFCWSVWASSSFKQDFEFTTLFRGK